MIVINVDPIAFTIGHFAMLWHIITSTAAVVTAVVMAWHGAKRAGIRPRIFVSMAAWAIVGGALGSKLVHVIDLWDHYSAHPGEILRIEGHAIYGVILGALLAVWGYAKISGTPFWRLGDLAAPGAALGQAIGRVGCIIQGCCHGIPTSLPWAVVYTHPNCYGYVPLNKALHPTQAYFLLWNLVVFALLWWLRRQPRPEGSLCLIYLALYSVGDFGLRFFRQQEPFLFGLHQGQVIGLAILAATFCIFAKRAFFPIRPSPS